MAAPEVASSRLRALSVVLAVVGVAGQALPEGAKPARTFEQVAPTRLGAEECWTKRQFEKEAYENLRMELVGCETARKAATESIGSGPCVRAPSPSPPPTTPAPSGGGGFCSFIGCASRQDVAGSSPAAQAAPGGAAGGSGNPSVARAGNDVRPSTTNAPVRDKRTGLCTWQALSNVPTGRWVSAAEARQYMGDSAPHETYPPYESKHGACVQKKNWYRCPNFDHTKQWLPDLVRERRCAMTYLTPPSLLNITRRPLRVLLHGDSLFKGLYKAFVCQWSRYVESEFHRDFRSKGNAEGWISRYHGGLELQYVYRDGGFGHLGEILEKEPNIKFRDMDEFDVLVTNFGNLSLYHEMAQLRGYNGMIVHASHGCARCNKGSTDRCHYGTLTSQAARRTLGYITLDLCALTLPQHNYNAMWAPGGKPMNKGDPHLCSPGPDNQLMNILVHMLASYFRYT